MSNSVIGIVRNHKFARAPHQNIDMTLMMAEGSSSRSSSRSKKGDAFLGKSFKDRLTLLGCPYTDGVDETWISELLFQQGEGRIRLLQWLFSRYDQKLAGLLEDQYYGSQAKVDSRLQKLLSVSSMLGLCQPDDIDLIRGSASHSKQAAFWDKLLDVVSVTDMSEDPLRKAEQEHGLIGDSTDIDDQFGSDCTLLSSLACQRDIHGVFLSSQPLLPPDLEKLVKRRAAEHEQATGKKFSPPSIKELDDLLYQMNSNLEREREHLEDLLSKYPYEDDRNNSKDTICQTLKLVLTEMAQLVTSFIHTFEAEMRPWCNKNPPRLTPLGPSSKRCQTLLSQFKQLLDDLKSIRSSFEHLSKYSKNPGRDQATSDTLSTIADISDSASQSYRHMESILEPMI